MTTNYEDYFLHIQPLLNQVVSAVARRQFLSADEADDLAGDVRLKLMEHDYALLRRFRGSSHLHTYLLAIATRHLLDARNARWGRWRPCRAAKLHGSIAIELDRLLTRDLMAFDEAYASLCARHDRVFNRNELFELSMRFPKRTSRRRWVDPAELERLPSEPMPGPSEANVNGIAAALAEAVRSCPPDDRRLIRLRFVDGRSIADIARLLRIEQKPLYRRFESLLTALRSRLEQRHITREALSAVGDARQPEIVNVLDVECGHGVSISRRPLAGLGKTA